MKIFKQDWSEESAPLIHHKGDQNRDISAEECPLCGKTVQVVGGKMKKHPCLEREK